MTFKPKQLDPKAVKIFSGNEVGTILEDIDEKLDLILESQNGMRAEAKTIKSDYQRLDERVGRTEVRLDAIEAR